MTQSIESKVKQMMIIQEGLNFRVNPAWRYELGSTQFRLAIMVELAELVEHLGYKWWSDKQPDLNQARMEAVDVFHFLLSYGMLIAKTHEYFGQALRCLKPSKFDRKSALNSAEFMFSHSVGIESTLNNFVELCSGLGITFDWLYKNYVGKAALNRFRWQDGYGSSYQKIWGGKEDNEHLTEILEQMPDEQVTLESVTDALKKRYTALVG